MRKHRSPQQSKYRAYVRAVSCAIVNLLPFPWRARQPKCVLLGRHYDLADPEDHQAFLSDFSSRLLLTYRSGFPPLNGAVRTKGLFRSDTSLTSDSGWGCMIRVFQMTLAQVMIHLSCGRDWRRPSNHHVIYPSNDVSVDPNVSTLCAVSFDTFNSESVYPWNIVPTLSQFCDTISARFSLHRIVALGREMLGINQGDWFGPTSCSQCLTALIDGVSLVDDETDRHAKPLYVSSYKLGAFHADGGEINRVLVHQLFKRKVTDKLPRCSSGRICTTDESERRASTDPGGHFDPYGEEPFTSPAALDLEDNDDVNPCGYDAVMLFLSLRLGLDSFNLRYQPFLQSCFGLEHFHGLAGGGPLTSAYWFVAANDEDLYFLDPHSPVQPAMLSVDIEAQLDSAVKAVACLKVNNQLASKEAVDSTFFPQAPKQLPWRSLNPSLTLVFLCKSGDDFEDLLSKLGEVDSEQILHITSSSTEDLPTNIHQEDAGFLLV